MSSIETTFCCLFSNLAFSKPVNLNTFKVEVTPWLSSKHNMGMAFNRTTWHEIKSCAKYFCSYDDYNWDWSLQQLSHQCLKKKLFAMVVRGPRVFHIGEW
jgi:alpha-1,6-mannosyl-glycoprotein beta-1,2-N-acetylglucosaminyltransferase